MNAVIGYITEAPPLPGRQEMFHQLDRLTESGREGALILIDIDGFHFFNERHGFYYGDQLLIEVGTQLQGIDTRLDGPYHLAGDQFAVIYHEGSGEFSLEQAVSSITRLLEHPVELFDSRFQVNLKLGIARWPDHAYEPEPLLLLAEEAVRQAKRLGVDHVTHDPLARQSYEELGRLQTELRSAVANGQLDIYFQPKVSLRGGGVSGLEALVRWEHDRHGLLSPDLFIPEAERSGLIRPLSRWMLNAALRQSALWRCDGVETTVAVNLSGRDMEDETLVDYIADLLDAWELEGSALEVEITESAAIDNFDRCRTILQGLNRLGVRIAIDDFGTGYSSFNYLRQLPVDSIKLDKSFISDISHNLETLHIVRSIIDLAHRLGKEVVAEGVDDVDKWEPLLNHGCDVVQGYQISKPLSTPAITRWLHQRGQALQPALVLH